METEMGKWLIIVGYDKMGGFWKITNGNTVKCDNDVEVRYSIHSFSDYSIILVSTNGEMNSNCYRVFFSQIKINLNDEIIIFSHEFRKNGHRYGSTEEELEKLSNEQTNTRYRLYPGSDADKNRNYPFWLAVNILENIEELSTWIPPSWEELVKESKKKSLVKFFSLLKHYIMTSFLDLDIDWQGIKEVNEKDKENAKEYLNDILKGKSNNYYCQKLVNLWFYLTGKNDLKIDDKVTTSLDKKDLPYEKSVLDLINKSTKEIKENLEKRLRTLLKHVELENENKNKSEKVPSVIDYLKNLDKMIKDKKERDINKFLNFDFHEWYLKLGDLLEELKSFLE